MLPFETTSSKTSEFAHIWAIHHTELTWVQNELTRDEDPSFLQACFAIVNVPCFCCV